jgi:hypothetical protein
MSGFIEIQCHERVAARPAMVRAHYVDLHHRGLARVHPHERLRERAPGPAGPRFECLARSGWSTGLDVWERHERSDGSVLDRCVAGPHWGRSIIARFLPERDAAGVGTVLELTLTQPLRPFAARHLGRWLRVVLAAELRGFAVEIRADVERDVRPRRRLRAA